MVGARMTFIPMTVAQAAATSTSLSGPYMTACIDLGSVNTTPGGVTVPLSKPDGRAINPSIGMPHRDYQWHFRDRNRFQWQNVGSAGDPYTGAYGQFSYYLVDITSGNPVVWVAHEYEVEFRGRG